MRVLIVDDSRATCSLTTRVLAGRGHEVVSAGDGRAALEVLQACAPLELALIDWNMPIMNGLELVHEIRRDAERELMKIKMVTTECEIERIALALDSGATEYLMKPFSAAALHDKLLLLGLQDAA